MPRVSSRRAPSSPRLGPRAFRVVTPEATYVLASTSQSAAHKSAFDFFRNDGRPLPWRALSVTRWPELDSWAAADTSARPWTLAEIESAQAESPDVPVQAPIPDPCG